MRASFCFCPLRDTLLLSCKLYSARKCQWWVTYLCTFHLPFSLKHGYRLMLGSKRFLRVSTLWRQYRISSEEFPIALGVLRMIKLFGWEHKMSETIKQKRDEELVWIWKDKVKWMLRLVKLILTFNIPFSCSICYPLLQSNITLLTVYKFSLIISTASPSQRSLCSLPSEHIL